MPKSTFKSANLLPFVQSISMFEYMPDLVFLMTAPSAQEIRYLYMNQSAMRVSGLNEYAYGATFQDVVEPVEADFLHHQYTQALMNGKSVSFVLNHNGQIGESMISPISYHDGHLTYMLGIVRDITPHVEREKKLEHLAYRDHLTGLWNRRATRIRLQEAVKQAGLTDKMLSILLLDCDKFKWVNDQYGHLTGDLLLRDLSNRLQRVASSAHTIARLGGDEFLVAILVKNEMETFELAENILEIMRRPWGEEEKFPMISVSMGMATFPIDSLEIQRVIQIADRGLYRAKELGGNQYMLERAMF